MPNYPAEDAQQESCNVNKMNINRLGGNEDCY